MHLVQIQQRAWQTAEDKGLHKTLDGVTQLGPRETALHATHVMYGKITAITQEIKRHGVTNIPEIQSLIGGAIKSLVEFSERIRDTTQPTPVPKDNTDFATTIRLVLCHTEIDEGIEVVRSSACQAERNKRLAEEIVDDIIRHADNAQCLGLDLDAAIESKLNYNDTRPYQFGTPGEGKVDHGAHATEAA